MRAGWRGSIAAAALLCPGCFQELDSGADKMTTQAPPTREGPSTAIEPGALPIELNPDDEAQTTENPCDKTRQDAKEILTAYCAGCHSGPTASGLPPFGFVLDDKRLVTEVWSRVGQADQRFVIPGDPEHSALYLRAKTDMPPIPTDLGTSRAPSPSWSDVSVLREWIARCL